MDNPESVIENPTDNLILARRPDFVIVKKKRTCRTVDLSVTAKHGVKLKESEIRDKYVDLARELKKNYLP